MTGYTLSQSPTAHLGENVRTSASIPSPLSALSLSLRGIETGKESTKPDYKEYTMNSTFSEEITRVDIDLQALRLASRKMKRAQMFRTFALRTFQASLIAYAVAITAVAFAR